MRNIDSYYKNVKNKLSSHFNIDPNFSISGNNFDFLASFNEKNTKFALLKEIKIYEFETNEYFLFISEKTNDLFSPINKLEQIKGCLKEIARPHENHMSSQVLLVYVTEDEIDEDLVKKAARFKYQKGFAFGFKGWADLGLVVISLKSNRVVTHKKFVKTASFLTPDRAV